MEILTERSSNIKRAEYSKDAQKLLVEFKTGAAYEYENIPYDVFLGLKNAESYGRYFAKNIKRHYKGKRV